MKINAINTVSASPVKARKQKTNFKGAPMQAGGEVIKHVMTGTAFSGLAGVLISALAVAALLMKSSENEKVKKMSYEEQDQYLDDLIKKDIAFNG